jgi:hypothetical protein
MHDKERRLKIIFGINAHGKLIDPKEWIDKFKRFGKNKLAKSMLIKLALTPITVFAQDVFADESKTKLIPCLVTNLWISAYRIAGAPWNRKTTPPKKVLAKPSNLKTSNKPTTTKPNTYAAPIAIPSPPPQEAHGVSFEPIKKAPGLFLSRSSRKPTKASKAKADQRKFNDKFYTIKTPPMDNHWKEGGLEMTSYFNNIMDYIMDKDKKAIIHSWDNKPGIHLSKKSEPLKNRVQTRKYANSLYLRQGFPVNFRLRVSHDVIPSLIKIDSDKDGLHIQLDHVQEKDLTIIGFLVDSSPMAANLEDMQEAHENHPTLYGIKLIAKDQAIKLTSGKNEIP